MSLRSDYLAEQKAWLEHELDHKRAELDRITRRLEKKPKPRGDVLYQGDDQPLSAARVQLDQDLEESLPPEYPLHCEIPPDDPELPQPVHWRGGVSRRQLRRADRWYSFDRTDFSPHDWLHLGRRPVDNGNR